MNFFRKIPLWGAASGLLIAAALIFRFAMRGYSYIAHSLTFFAALIIMHRFFPKTLWRICLVLVCIGFIYFIIVEIPIIKNARTDENPERDYLIVLGAAVHGDKPSLALENRLKGAMDYLNKYPQSIAIVSGGQGKGELLSEAQMMYDYLTDHGIDPERILTENKSTSTKENLLYSFEIIKSRGDNPDGNIAIVSSCYHLYRAKSMAEMLGAEAAGVAGYWDYPIATLNYFIREAFGVTHLWAFGW